VPISEFQLIRGGEKEERGKEKRGGRGSLRRGRDVKLFHEAVDLLVLLDSPRDRF